MPENMTSLFLIYCHKCGGERLAMKGWRWRDCRYGERRFTGINRCQACGTDYDAPIEDGQRGQSLPSVAP